jgi:hypothetical protein
MNKPLAVIFAAIGLDAVGIGLIGVLRDENDAGQDPHRRGSLVSLEQDVLSVPAPTR